MKPVRSGYDSSRAALIENEPIVSLLDSLYPHTRVDIQERMDVILLVTINHVNIGLFTLNRPYNNNEKEH